MGAVILICSQARLGGGGGGCGSVRFDGPVAQRRERRYSSPEYLGIGKTGKKNVPD